MLLDYAYAMGTGEGAPQGGPSPIIGLTPILLMFLIFYFLLIRPQQRRQREHQQLISQLKKNDRVITSGGIHGTIVNVKEATVILKVDGNVTIEVQKNCVSAVKQA